MAFEYNPKDANNTLPEGTYPASIKTVVDTDDAGEPLKSSTKGESMQKVIFEVYPPGGTTPRQLTAFYTAKSGLWQYKKLAAALGQAEQFKARTFNAAEHLGANLKLTLSVEETTKYGDQNRIEAYLPSDAGTVLAAAAANGAAGSITRDNDIPF